MLCLKLQSVLQGKDWQIQTWVLKQFEAVAFSLVISLVDKLLASWHPVGHYPYCFVRTTKPGYAGKPVKPKQVKIQLHQRRPQTEWTDIERCIIHCWHAQKRDQEASNNL